MEDMEQWKAVVGYEGSYEVSDQGRVRSLTRTIDRGQYGEVTYPGKMMYIGTRKEGYKTVQLRLKGDRKKKLVHHLVLEAFVGPRPEGMEARHLNDDKGDARLENLEWGTRSENNLDRTRNGIDHYRNRKSCPRGHLLEEPNLVPSQLKRGHRSCLACERAYGSIKGNPEVYSSDQHPAIADIHYENITGEAKRLYAKDILAKLDT